MADMLVDSAKLNACLDAEADAIRAKTGGSADIPFDYANNKGFADAIAAIPSGGGGDNLELLASGEYTLAEKNTTSFSIPVSFTGTAKQIAVIAKGFPNIGWRTVMWFAILNLTNIPTVVTDVYDLDDSLFASVYQQTANSATRARGYFRSKIVNSEIVCSSTTAYPALPTTYDWYIWGVRS